MGRRRNRDDDFLELILKLVGLAIMLCVITPQGRALLVTLGLIAAWAAVLAVGGLVAFLIYRKVRADKNLPEPAEPESDSFKGHLKSVFRIPWPDDGEVEEPAEPAINSTAELLDRLRAIDWFQFEKVVALAYAKLGYAVTRRGGANADGGIDLVLTKDGRTAAVQCKQWKTWTVGVKPVREFLGAMKDAGIEHGIFITLQGYSGDAKQLADRHGIEILNETGLAEMMESTGAKSDPEVLALLQDARKFCPKCENEMVVRTAGKGQGAGNQFWGCSAYPRCRFTLPME